MEHLVHVRDAGGVEAQRLVEGPRLLPSRKEGIRCGARCGPGGGRRRATAVHAACRGGLDCRLGAGHREERTQNMPYMFVTLEVSKLSGWLNADADCRESKGGHTVQEEVQRTGRVPYGAGQSTIWGAYARVPYDADEVGGGRAWGSGGASGAQGGARL